MLCISSFVILPTYVLVDTVLSSSFNFLHSDPSARGQALKESTNVVGLAQKRLRLKPSKKTAQVYKPLPQVVRTNLYDEHWAAKQERGTNTCNSESYSGTSILWTLGDQLFLFIIGRFKMHLHLILQMCTEVFCIVSRESTKRGSTVLHIKSVLVL